MTTFPLFPSTPSTSSRPSTPSRLSWRRRAARVARWAVRVVLAAQFAVGGVLKLVGDPTMLALFADLGAGEGLRLLIGVCEVAGGIGLLLPRISRLAAAGLVALMIGAATANVVVLHVSPVVPLVLGALGLLVAVTGTRKESGR